MPLIKIEHLTKGRAFAIWNATESINFFLPQLPGGYMTGFDMERFSEIRKKEFLASRYLLKQLLNDDNTVLEMEKNGSLLVGGSKRKISLSHSKAMIAVITGEEGSVGIDIEEIRDRVKKVMHKFLNEVELKSLGNTPELWKVVLCWSAKESIYKMMGKPGMSFRNEMMLDIPADRNCNKFKAVVTASDNKKEVEIHFEQIGKFILTYCFDEITAKT